MTIKRRRISKFEVILVLLFIGLFCVSVLPPCLASENDPISGGKILETITVTAQKRKEDVQKVTNSITVLSDVTIEDASLESTKDVWRYVPNMATSTGARSHWSRIRMRGISNAAFGDPAVALYIDDVSYAGLYAFDSPLFDIERIEVLKGPQGTLYGSTAIVTDNAERTESELLPKLALDYRINKNLMTYASVAKGYKAGGYSYAVDDPGLAAFDPEVSTAFELGLKTEFPEQKLRVNLAGFYTKVDDYQDRVMLDYSTVVQANVTKTDIYGFELEASYALTRDLALNGFIGYTNAEYGDYIDPMTQVNYRGNRATYIPEYDAGLFLEYRNRLGLFARAEMQYIGCTYFDRANTREQDAYALYHMKLGYEQEKWDIYLCAKNLTDKQYVADAFDTGSTVGWMASMGDPRTISLIFNYRF